MKQPQAKVTAAALFCCAGMAYGQVWNELGDAGDLPVSAQAVTGAGTLSGIAGTMDANDVDMYRFLVCDAANFSATTVGQVTWDTQLWLFSTTGVGVVYNDDSPAGTLQSRLTNLFVPANGEYLIAITRYNRDAVDASNQLLWLNAPFNVERAPDGPGAANPVASWVNTTVSGGTYTIAMTGSCFIAGGPTGACCLGAPGYSCITTSSSSCATAGGTYLGDGSLCSSCPPPPTGACCLNDGTCQTLTQLACITANGTYAGNGVLCAAANCPPGGACCFFATCSTLTSAACAAQGGAWLGAGSACGSCPTPYAETGDAGDLPATAESVNGSGTLVGIVGNLGTGDADMFKINVCNAANFEASTVGLTTVDTQLFLFKSDGTGVAVNDDHVVIAPEATTLQSRITSQFVAPLGNGDYYLGISQYNKDPQGNVTSGLIWLDTPFRSERAPDGPASGEAVGSWTTTTGVGGNYGIRLSGACYLGGAGGCYANCDGSTGNPLLTANDFQCFLNKYASGDPYANCDGSTGTPALTANDFQCFINKYAGGCT
ncbi:MAG: DVUA0089 family protein [Phycisphaeraceae bacterium]|nr:DVUA0089 family protein [Phycisphaeraceae bacterium]